jgi:hypothetical protein
LDVATTTTTAKKRKRLKPKSLCYIRKYLYFLKCRRWDAVVAFASATYTPGKHLMPPDGAVTHFQVGGGGCKQAISAKKKKKKGGLSSAAAVWTWNTLGQQRRALYRFFFSFLFLIGASLLPHI